MRLDLDSLRYRQLASSTKAAGLCKPYSASKRWLNLSFFARSASLNRAQADGDAVTEAIKPGYEKQ